MFHPAVLLLLQQAGGLLGIQTGGVPNACTPTDALNKDIVTAHNDFRTSLTQGQYGPGSKSVFALTYSCENEGYAMTILTEDCKRNKKDLTSQGVSDNFFTHYLSGVTQLDDADVAEFYPFAVDKWANTLETNLNSQALYEDEGAAEFANMANYKALKVGCTHKFCPGTKLGKVAMACVYSAIPKLGEPLYTPVANGKGCTADTTCKKVIKESICQTDATTGTKGPLCETNATEVASKHVHVYMR
ncbi:SCP-like protein [Oesophagostomum dentatum]|uniref:SCP-like protein n=1 Tax=Oesophagostomum dentatum TaxID=61180 RepID=A0A0B1TN80_OESDE|nr:SCP-like protein [Oesophagostomum dentatum]